MGSYITTAPGHKTVSALLEKLGDYVTDLEELQSDLSDYTEYYMDDLEDTLEQAVQYAQETSRVHEMNGMLRMELNAGRKELIELLRLMADNGIQPPEGIYIHHRRLDPDLYEQDPDSPFYIPDQDGHYESLLTQQLGELARFEEYTPMTTSERKALRNHVICSTGFDPDPANEWNRFLDGLRDEAARVIQEGR